MCTYTFIFCFRDIFQVGFIFQVVYIYIYSLFAQTQATKQGQHNVIALNSGPVEWTQDVHAPRHVDILHRQ